MHGQQKVEKKSTLRSINFLLNIIFSTSKSTRLCNYINYTIKFAVAQISISFQRTCGKDMVLRGESGVRISFIFSAI